MTRSEKQCVVYAGLVLTSGESELMTNILLECETGAGLFSVGLDVLGCQPRARSKTAHGRGTTAGLGVSSPRVSGSPMGVELPRAV